jgi:hypothetical protein
MLGQIYLEGGAKCGQMRQSDASYLCDIDKNKQTGGQTSVEETSCSEKGSDIGGIACCFADELRKTTE